jgi:hypothetical protein
MQPSAFRYRVVVDPGPQALIERVERARVPNRFKRDDVNLTGGRVTFTYVQLDVKSPFTHMQLDVKSASQ